MTIAKLDTSTARLLGSSVGITSPYAVVKELLDNAIDAGADSADIAISANTLDSIRVRDNGHGIDPDDLNRIGRPAHTSKISTADELNTGQIQTLGFRGQALSNINRIATVHIITKTAEEPVASKIQLHTHLGGIDKSFAPVSAPTGTTMQITELFYNMLPRKQFLLKESRKNMGKIKELLMAYVLANTDLRIIFKVSGDEKQCCNFGQTKDRDMKQAVLELFGSTVAAGGETHRLAETKSPTSTFTLVAFLPIANINPKAIRGKGSFISVNGRPLCATVGIGKALTAVFKAKIQQSWQLRGFASVPQPLIVLEITCPSTMYDINVATMKDDLLFADTDVLLRAFEGLCCAVYDKITIPKGRDGGTIKETSYCQNTKLQNDDHDMPREKLVSAQMRTVSKVNMFRTNSNVTDEGADPHLVEVMLPETFPMCKERYIADTSSKVDTAISLRGIERYFQPSGSEFEIATDDTATPETSRVTEEECIQFIEDKFLPRMPLSTVSDSMLNILAGTQGPASDVSSQGDAPRLSDLNSTSWSIQNLINQNVFQMPSRGATITHASPPQRSSPQIRGQRPEGRQIMNAPQRPVISTPPSSDPTREEQGILPASHILRSGVRSRPLPGSSSDSNDFSDDISSIEEHHTAREGQNTQRRAFPISQIRIIESEAVPSRILRQDRLTATRLGRSLAHHRGDDEETSAREDILRPLQFDDPQMPRRGHRHRRAESIHSEANSGVRPTSNQPPSKRHCGEKRGIQQLEMPESDSHPPVNVDNADLLRLEYIPATMATWSSILTTDVGFCDVRISMSLLKTLDTYLQTGELEPALSSLSRRGAVELEARVEHIRQAMSHC